MREKHVDHNFDKERGNKYHLISVEGLGTQVDLPVFALFPAPVGQKCNGLLLSFAVELQK